ncbi:MAG: DUF4349 domain-containing protein [Acidimicrobiia bacterium]
MRRLAISTPILLALTLALAACWGGTASEEAAGGETATGAPATAAPAPTMATTSDETARTLIGFQLPAGRHVIRNASLELISADTQATFDRITALVEAAGGYVSQASVLPTGGSEEQPEITMQLKVPSDRLTATLADLERTADEVRSQTITTQDVTEEFADIEAQLTNLLALETELRDLLAEVRQREGTDADDLLAVFERIRSNRTEIERLQGREQLLGHLVALATVDVLVVPLQAAEPIVAEGWHPQAVAQEALRRTVASFQGMADALIWVGLFILPVLVVLAVPVGVGWLLVRRSRKPHAAPE